MAIRFPEHQQSPTHHKVRWRRVVTETTQEEEENKGEWRFAGKEQHKMPASIGSGAGGGGRRATANPCRSAGGCHVPWQWVMAPTAYAMSSVRGVEMSPHHSVPTPRLSLQAGLPSPLCHHHQPFCGVPCHDLISGSNLGERVFHR